jgi:hypothetical protein
VSRESAIAAGQAAALVGMASRCNVRRKTGAKTVVGGFEVPAWATIHADLEVKVGGANAGSSQSRKIDAGGVDVEVPVRVASFPAGTNDLRDGDLVEIVSGDTEGLVLRIVEADPKDWATARRVQVIGATRPGEWT